MLRLAVIVLLLANAGYFAWSQGHLRPWGWAPQEQAEPQRMNQQIRPETLQILKVNASKTSSSTPVPAPPPCSPRRPHRQCHTCRQPGNRRHSSGSLRMPAGRCV
jgi:hypothetical protein